jgi:Arc/MetJ family transcription regulator
MDLDVDLVGEAAQVLGTSRLVDTVHAALADVVRRKRRLALLEIENSLTLADLDEMRAHRFAESPEAYGPDRAE